MQNILSSQQFIVTTAVFLAAIGGFAGLAIMDRRPRESLEPSLIPTTPLMLITGMAALLALVHLVNLLGVKTGG
jgi:amino acid transporter